MELNEVLERLPKHLMSLVIDQPYNDYTAQDHALWRYVMRQNVQYLSGVAHKSYFDGLRKTGISIDHIPHMYGMNRILKEIGWAAVAVDGFIPPAAFMEFQAYNVLVIAADIRPINQIEYTPAPDIIHEAAGHAPIIADFEYADYLRFFGEIGSKALSSAADYKLYEAIRHLSILKADPYTTPQKIHDAEAHLSLIEQNIGEPSEMALIRNLHWWTVEYGLVGDIKNPKIYGAGLLSSIGESYSALNKDVIKLPYTLDAVNYNFDITTKQPQLFVTPDFTHLTNVLNDFINSMAFRTGGLEGITKAVASGNTATVVYSSSLQVSGTFSNVIANDKMPAYIKTNTPTSLSYNYKELPGHGIIYHKQGFGSPIGKLITAIKSVEDFSEADLNQLGIIKGKKVKLEFESGVTVKGKVMNFTRKEGKLLIISFTNCLVVYNGEVLFEPSWGIYDMAVGEFIISVFSGPADADAFGLSYPVPEEKTHKIFHTKEARKLHGLYQQVRDIREKGIKSHNIEYIWYEIKNNYPDEWLLPVEILEILTKVDVNKSLASEISNYLNGMRFSHPSFSKLIIKGQELLAQVI